MNAQAPPEVAPASRTRTRSRDTELVRAARSRRPGARAELVDSFLPLIRSVAQIYRHVPGIDRRELVQEGVVGLLRALERFEPEQGTPFWAYASWWVRQAMQQLVAELSRPVVLSDRALRKLARARDARRSFAAEHAREPGLRELADLCETSVEQLQSLHAADRPSRGLDEPVHGFTEGGATFGETLSDAGAEEPYEDLLTRGEVSDLPRLLASVSERERMVIEVRYGLGGRERTLRELGQRMGVSAERVRQIEQGALEKMRAVSAGSVAADDRAASIPASTVRGSARAGARSRPRHAGERRKQSKRAQRSGPARGAGQAPAIASRPLGGVSA
jgi:RNA polymerase primary sigma factor